MARAIWKGIITLKSIKVPVKLYSAIQPRDIHFNLLHDEDLERVKQKMVNPTTGEEVSRESIMKGMEIEPGQFVIVNDEDLEALTPVESRDITIKSFVATDQISHQWYERPYYLGPDGDNEQYFALVAALEKQDKQGVARWTMRKKEYVGALRLEKGYLMLITLRFASEVIAPSEIEAPTGRKPDAREIEMAEQLVNTLYDKFDPTQFKDEYRERVLEFVERKAKGEKIRLHKPREKKPPDKSLTEALKASIAAAKKERRSA